MNYILAYDIWGVAHLDENGYPIHYSDNYYLYGKTHIISLIIVILALAAFLVAFYFLAKKSKKAYTIGIKIFAVWMILFEIGWRVLFLTSAPNFINQDYHWYPAYACNFTAIMLPIACLTGSKIMKHMFYVFAIVGACLMMLYPSSVFVEPYITIGAIKSLLQHWNIILLVSAEILVGEYKVKFRNYWLGWLGMIVVVINCTFITWILYLVGVILKYGDYLFFNFFGAGTPGYVIIPAIATVVLALIMALSDRKGFKEFTLKFKEFWRRERELDKTE